MSAAEHAAHGEHLGPGHLTAKGYLIGFVLAAALTAIPFWLVMNHVVSPAVAASPSWAWPPCRWSSTWSTSCTWTPGPRAAGTFGPALHRPPGRHRADRLTLGHASPGRQHDADDAAGDAAGPVMAGRARRGVALAMGALLFAGFTALGAWQLQRLAWKLDLIARVAARTEAAPAPPPRRKPGPA